MVGGPGGLREEGLGVVRELREWEGGGGGFVWLEPVCSGFVAGGCVAKVRVLAARGRWGRLPLLLLLLLCSQHLQVRESDIGTRGGLFEVVKIGDEFFTFIVDCKVCVGGVACWVVFHFFVYWVCFGGCEGG